MNYVVFIFMFKLGEATCIYTTYYWRLSSIQNLVISGHHMYVLFLLPYLSCFNLKNKLVNGKYLRKWR